MDKLLNFDPRYWLSLELELELNLLNSSLY